MHKVTEPKDKNASAAGNEPIVEECPVCKEIIDQRPFTACLRCKQRFCTECWNEWFKVKTTCPLCRAGPDGQPVPDEQQDDEDRGGFFRDLSIVVAFPSVLSEEDCFYFINCLHYFLGINEDQPQPLTMTFQRYSITLDSRGFKIHYGEDNEEYLRDLFPQFTLPEIMLPENFAFIIDTLRDLLEINEDPMLSEPIF
jgi:hypothetical protein